MSELSKFTDQLLTAYLDGEVDADVSREIAIALETDRDLMARVEALSMPVEELKRAFDDLLGAAPAPPDIPQISTPTAGVRSKAIIGGIAASVTLGICLGIALMAIQVQPKDWRSYAAAYHALYVTDTLSKVEIAAGDQAQLITSLSVTFGRDLSAALNDQVLQFKRGQLLGYQGNPLIQLAYLSPLGEPVALCITRASRDGETAIKSVTREGMAAAEWNHDGLAFLLIGGRDSTLIEDAATRLAAGL